MPLWILKQMFCSDHAEVQKLPCGAVIKLCFLFSVFQNVTNTVVKTVLRNDYSAQGVIHHLKVASPIHCVFQNNLLTSSGYTAEG